MALRTFIVGLLGIACVAFNPWGASAQNTAGLAPREAEAARRTIVAWLECEECTEGELRSVVRLGNAAVPTLAAVSAGGPAPAMRAAYRERLSRAYDSMTEHAKGSGRDGAPPMTKEEYINFYLSNYTALYKIRASEALARIGGEDAKSALNAAIKSAERPDVREAIKKALSEVR